MRVCHGFTAVFDDPNLVSCAGLAPVLTLAERAGLERLVAGHVSTGKPGGAHPGVKVGSLVAGMVAGADSIDDMALLRHGGMGRPFTGVRAPSTLGTFLRSFTFGHVRQLDAVASRLLINLTQHAPLLPGAGELAYVDVDDTLRRTYGYAKQGAGRGYTGVKGLNALIAVVSTPGSAPVIAAARLRKGSTNSTRGAARLVADALVTAKAAGASGVRVLRADSAFYSHDVIAAATRQGARFSITATGRCGARSTASTSRRGPRSGSYRMPADDVTAFAEAVAEAPAGSGPDSPPCCTPDHRRGDEAVVVRVPTTDGLREVVVWYAAGCGNGADDGVTLHTLTPDLLRPLFHGPVQASYFTMAVAPLFQEAEQTS